MEEQLAKLTAKPRTKERQQQSLLHIKSRIQVKKRKEYIWRYCTIACAAILLLLFTATTFIQPSVQTLSGKPIKAVEYFSETPKPWYHLDKNRLSKEGIKDMQSFISQVSSQIDSQDIDLSGYYPNDTELVIYRDQTFEKFTFYTSEYKETAYLLNNTTGAIGEINKRDYLAVAGTTLKPASDSALKTQIKLLLKALLFAAYISIVMSINPQLRPLLSTPVKWYKVVVKFFIFSIVLGVFSFLTSLIAGYPHAIVALVIISLAAIGRISLERYSSNNKARRWAEIPFTIAVYYISYIINFL